MKRLCPRKSVLLLSCAVLFALSRVGFASTVPYAAATACATLFNPSSDSLSLNAGPISSAPGVFTFQTGTFVVGDSEIPDQDLPFTFEDTVTFNGITQTLSLSGDDSVTSAADTLTIAPGLPVYFGGEFLTLEPFSLLENDLGEFPITLEATISPAPEPGAVLLLGTIALFSAILGIRRTRDMPGGPAEVALS